MADYRIKAQKTGPRTYKKELQLINYRGSSLFTDEGNVLISEKDVYYPPDYLASDAVAVVADPQSYENDGLSTANKFRKGQPAALPVEEQFPRQTEVSRTLLGIDRSETQQGLFDDVSSYGLDRKDWVAYGGWPDWQQGNNWERKNSPAGPHIATRDYDYAEGSSVVLSTYPVPYYNPGNPPVSNRLRGISANPGPGWGRYIQSVIAMYIIEYMVNNFTAQEKGDFRLEFLEQKYPKTADGKFNRLYWDQMWMDIDQGRFEENRNIPIIPQGTIVNLTPDDGIIDLVDLFGSTLSIDDKDVDVNFNQFFFASTRYGWFEPDQGHYRIKTTANKEVWTEYWGIDYDSLPQNLKDWEFEVYESADDIPQFVKDYKLPYFLITSKVPSESLIFGPDWPQAFSDPEIPQIAGAVAAGNVIGARQSSYAVQTLTSTRAFRYQPGRISGFTYGTRISEEGAGPGTVLEWGVENFTDGYFFRLEEGTDFAIVRRSIIPLGTTPLFTEAGYEEREAYISQLTGVVTYKDTLSDTEVAAREEEVTAGNLTKVYETVIQQNQMNGDGLNSQGESGYIYNPDTVTMYKIEFGWYGAIGARFYVYIPQSSGVSRWVTVHTLVIENQLGEPCLGDPFFFFKYRAYMDSPSRIRLPQFVEKYGASYYIDGGDEGTVSVSSGSATNREVKSITSTTSAIDIYDWSTVLGLKPKQYIINNDGNEFQNKKEIFPISASVSSTVDAELKFVSQFGCQEHGYTFQEGYTCVLPESQRLRGIFDINPLRKDETALVALGRDEDEPAPTITYVSADSDFTESSSNLESGGSFIGWNAYSNTLHGSKIVADKVYGAYVNPEQEGVGSAGYSGSEALLARVTRNSGFSTLPKNRPWSYGELLFKYVDNVKAKLSRFRRDTTLFSTVDIRTSEFYLYFTVTGPTADQYETLCTEDSLASRCDGSHFGDISIGVLWPNASTSTSYPTNIYNLDRAENHNKSFGIIDPKIAQDQTNLSGDSFDVKIVEDSGNYYVQDKTIPNSDSYRYYEGLPLDLLNPTIANNNTLRVNQAGWVAIGQGGLEVSEGVVADGIGHIDSQLPGVPGTDGGRCRAIFGRAGDINEIATFTDEDEDGNTTSGVFYLSKQSSWPRDLASQQNDLFVVEESSNTVITVTTTGDPQQIYTPEGSSARLYLLPVTIKSGSAFPIGTIITAKYRAIALYAPSLLRPDARIIARKVVGQNIFPIRFFVSMREGASIGGLTVGQVTPNGIIQTPFTPHGSTLSINHFTNTNNAPDRHDGGSSDDTNSAFKAIKTFIEPDTLSTADFSYYDTSDSAPVDRTKKCNSFLSRTLLSGAGFSGVGDYPIRWLKFKDSGDPVGSLFISANKPTELDLTQFFGISTESVGPSFWSNKALFMIARNLEENKVGKMSITLNYKEQ
jgi:hypothetical protein